VAITVPGVVDRASVSSGSLDDVRGRSVGLNITRQTDANSPRLAEAERSGAPGATATLSVRRLTPLGWVRELTLTMADCTVSSYVIHENYESVGLTFSSVQVEQQ
jgi:type VI protein secretion system component Hcp